MNIINLSAEPIGKLHAWLPSDLNYKKVVFLPDACPGKSPLPTGTVVHTNQENWRKFAISDCGCGMRLLKSKKNVKELDRKKWNNISNLLQKNKGRLGDLGGGNHFLDALQSYSDDFLYFLIHTGSRDESGIVDNLIENKNEFDKEFNRVVNWASENRATIQNVIETEYDKLEIIFDLPHNTVEILEDESIIIRKGAIRLCENDIAAIPSHMTGDVALIKGTDKSQDILYSMSHGTGRKMSRSECKPLAESYNFNEMRKKILLPDCIDNSSLRTEGPYAYRELDDCLSLLQGYVEEIDRFSVIGYMGHL